MTKEQQRLLLEALRDLSTSIASGEPVAAGGTEYPAFETIRKLEDAFSVQRNQELPNVLRLKVAELTDQRDLLRAALAPFARESLSTEPGAMKTRVFSMENFDDNISRAREAMEATG